jgi:hypothetical protein
MSIVPHSGSMLSDYEGKSGHISVLMKLVTCLHRSLVSRDPPSKGHEDEDPSSCSKRFDLGEFECIVAAAH